MASPRRVRRRPTCDAPDDSHHPHAARDRYRANRAVAGAGVASLVLILEIISFVQLIYAGPLPVLTGFLGGVGLLFVRSGLQVGAAPQVDLR